ncbi:MAG: DUF3634 family protein [Planctomycetes bacterium]|nr:DUF3634 family protein [Planctomycetota bacterium]
MDFILPIVCAATFLAWVGWLARPNVVFQIRYRRGIPKVVRGRLTDATLNAIDEICRQNSVKSGTITAMPGKRVRMKFTSDIPPGCQQQIRNMMLFG